MFSNFCSCLSKTVIKKFFSLDAIVAKFLISVLFQCSMLKKDSHRPFFPLYTLYEKIFRFWLLHPDKSSSPRSNYILFTHHIEQWQEMYRHLWTSYFSWNIYNNHFGFILSLKVTFSKQLLQQTFYWEVKSFVLIYIWYLLWLEGPNNN